MKAPRVSFSLVRALAASASSSERTISRLGGPSLASLPMNDISVGTVIALPPPTFPFHKSCRMPCQTTTAPLSFARVPNRLPSVRRPRHHGLHRQPHGPSGTAKHVAAPYTNLRSPSLQYRVA